MPLKIGLYRLTLLQEGVRAADVKGGVGWLFHIDNHEDRFKSSRPRPYHHRRFYSYGTNRLGLSWNSLTIPATANVPVNVRFLQTDSRDSSDSSYRSRSSTSKQKPKIQRVIRLKEDGYTLPMDVHTKSIPYPGVSWIWFIFYACCCCRVVVVVDDDN